MNDKNNKGSRSIREILSESSNILNQNLKLCFFKGTLVDQVRSVPFLRLALIVNILLGIFVQANITEPLDAFIQIFLQIMVTIIYITLLLYYIKSLNFFVQMLTAILVSQNFLYFIGVPLTIWVTITDELLVYYALGGLLFWGIAIIAYILRQLLFFDVAFSIIMALIFYLIVYGGAFFISSVII